MQLAQRSLAPPPVAATEVAEVGGAEPGCSDRDVGRDEEGDGDSRRSCVLRDPFEPLFG